MREIKFRAKDTLERNWYVGSYVFTDDNKNDPFRSRPFKESHRIIFYSSGDWNMGRWCDVEIDPSTLGQYTGLKDKNSKEIYEGDIVKVCILSPNYIGKNPEPYYVDAVCVYSQGSFCYKRISPFSKKKLSRNWAYKPVYRQDIYTVEIIGNIHDNKELLKEE